MAFLDSVRGDSASETRLSTARAQEVAPAPTADVNSPQTAQGLQAVEPVAAPEPQFDSYRVQLDGAAGKYTEVLDTDTGEVLQRIPNYEVAEAAPSASDITA